MMMKVDSKLSKVVCNESHELVETEQQCDFRSAIAVVSNQLWDVKVCASMR